MTHSLHRCGQLQEMDYVWLLYHVKGINDQDLMEKLRRAIAIAEEAGTVNWGDVKLGPIVSIPSGEVKAKLTEKSRIRGVFTSREQVTQFLRKMRQANLGLCVIISGLLDKVFQSCQEAGVKPHTVNYSLGVFGKKELLADNDTLAITTMCGHHMIPDAVVREMRENVRKGKIPAKKAATQFASLCPCGIFNHKRAEKLLRMEKRDTRPQNQGAREASGSGS